MSYSTDRYYALAAAGLCVNCCIPMGEDKRKSCTECANKKNSWSRRNPEKNKIASSKYLLARRKRVVEKYGGKCTCCGETEYTFLQFDHVKNDGANHRRQLKGKKIVTWIIENNYPNSIQVLCANCNHSKRINGGVCAHMSVVRYGGIRWELV